MRNFSYSTFTKKQAGVVYAAIKRGELEATRATVNRMYGLVGRNVLDAEELADRARFERCLLHIVEGRTEMAQAELDGKRTRLERVLVGTTTRTATEDDWFHEVGDEITEDVYEERWVMA